MPINGRAWKYGANIDTDVIIPGRYCNLVDPIELGKHALEDLDANFAKQVQPGDIIVAESNFGCGSSRELAPLAIKGAGVSAVVATSFARIFYRNAINIGLPIFESPQAAESIQQGHRVAIDAAAGVIRDLDTQQEFHSTPSPEFLQRIIATGGLIGYVEEKLAEKSKS